MDRKSFLKHSLLGGLGLGISRHAWNFGNNKSLATAEVELVGFNHIPPKEIKKMKSVLHKAETRGHANHGWLDTHHSFSFANWYNPERMNFGVLRVLNDDQVAAGKGFPTHPHQNMEIVSIPLEGDLEHKDSMGNTAVIKEGDVQVMSAGTGVYHSEYNRNSDKAVKFLQIWVIPNQQDVTPRYDQITLKPQASAGQFQQVLSPHQDDAGVWIHQNAWFHLGNFKAEESAQYQLKDPQKNGLYVFVLEGTLKVGNQVLDKRDGMGLWATETVEFSFNTDSRLLLMEVPMQVG